MPIVLSLNYGHRRPAEARYLKSLLSRLDALQEDLQRELNRLENTEAQTPLLSLKPLLSR